MLVFATKGAVPLVFMVEKDFLCVGSPQMVAGITFLENSCNKAELATLKPQEQPLFDPWKPFEMFG